jgi:hypothetical protein
MLRSMLTSSRSRVIVGAVAALLVAGVALAYVLLPPRQSADIAVPPDDASPEATVTAYLAALNAHDCSTAAAVMLDAESAESWCHRVASLRHVAVRESSVEEPEWSGRASYDDVVNVPVTFDLDWRLFGGDGSMEEGPTTWGYLLSRTSADEPWRIVDQGVG